MDKPQAGDIWEYTREGYSDPDEWDQFSFVLILEDPEEDYYICLNLLTGEIGDWLLDHGSEFYNWRCLA